MANDIHESDPPAAGRAGNSPRRVLCCTSRPEFAQDMAEICSNFGYEPFLANNATAYEQLAGHYHLAIFDTDLNLRADFPTEILYVSLREGFPEHQFDNVLIMDCVDDMWGFQRTYMFNCSWYCQILLDRVGHMTERGRELFANAIRRTSSLPPHRNASYYEYVNDEMLHSVVESSQAPLLVLDRDGKVWFANLAAQSIFRRPTYLMRDLPVEELFASRSSAPRFWKKVREIEHKLGESIEITLRDYEGNEFDALVMLNRVFGPNFPENALGFTLHNITQRKAAERALRKSEEEERRFQWRLRQLLEVNHHLSTETSLASLCRRAVEWGRNRLQFDRLSIWLLDRDGNHIIGTFGTTPEGNLRDERHLRLPINRDNYEVFNQDLPVMTYTRDDQEITNETGEVIGHGTKVHSLIRVGSTTLGFLNMDNLISGEAITHRDVELFSLYASTIGHLIASKKTEDALRASEEFLRQFVRQAPVAVAMFDTEMRYLMASERWNDDYELESQNLIGRSHYEVFPDIPERWKESHRRCLAGIAQSCEEDRFERENGKVLWIRWALHPWRNDNGEIGGLIMYTELVNEKKRQEEERRRLEAQVQHAQKLESLGVLAGGIAHDFNNLLMGILGHASLASMDLDGTSPVHENLQKIESAAQHAADLTRQLLAYSGRGKFVVQPLNLTTLVEEMVHLLTVSISKNATLKYRLAPNLPAVEADASQIRQVVMNLITNASEAIGEAQGMITIRTGLVECDEDYLRDAFIDEELTPGPYVFVEVSDTGEGMDAETRAKIFDPFFTTKFTGRGLGLAAVLGIVRGHHGALKVYSEKGEGSSFKVFFPATEVAEEDPIHPAGAAGVVHGAGTVLVIDDEETVRYVAERMLAKCGYQVLLAADGVEGVEVYQREQERITAVLLDMTMPRMNGEETFREIKRINREARVLLSSGYNEQEATSRFAGKGLAGFIQKPYRVAELSAKIRQATEKDGVEVG